MERAVGQHEEQAHRGGGRQTGQREGDPAGAQRAAGLSARRCRRSQVMNRDLFGTGGECRAEPSFHRPFGAIAVKLIVHR
jgi:hypothetical protein